MEGGKEVTPFDCTFFLDFCFAAIVPSRRLQALIIIICLAETSVLIDIYHNSLRIKYTRHQPVVDRLRSASSKGQVYYVGKSLFETVVGIGSG